MQNRTTTPMPQTTSERLQPIRDTLNPNLALEGQGTGWSARFAPRGKTTPHEDSAEASGIQLGKAIIYIK